MCLMILFITKWPNWMSPGFLRRAPPGITLPKTHTRTLDGECFSGPFFFLHYLAATSFIDLEVCAPQRSRPKKREYFESVLVLGKAFLKARFFDGIHLEPNSLH
jgi:hypothetical protein